MIFAMQRRGFRSAYRLLNMSCINYLSLSLHLWPPAEMKKKNDNELKRVLDSFKPVNFCYPL